MCSFKNETEALPFLVKGEIKAFNFIYRKYYQLVYANIYKFVKNEVFAEDLLQEVFIALWENRSQIKTDISVGGWLFTVSYNKSILFLKDKLKHQIFSQKTEQFENDFDEDEIIYQKKLEIFREALNTLSPKKKEIFVLCKMQNKRPEEISEDLGLTVISVKDYLKKSTKHVKQYVRVNYLMDAIMVLIFLSVIFI